MSPYKREANMILTTQPGSLHPSCPQAASSKRNGIRFSLWLSLPESWGLPTLVSFLPTHRGIHNITAARMGGSRWLQLTGTVQRKRLSCPLADSLSIIVILLSSVVY